MTGAEKAPMRVDLVSPSRKTFRGGHVYCREIWLACGVSPSCAASAYRGPEHCDCETHTAEEMERALAAGATLVGINNRDLATFVTDLGLSISLAKGVSGDVTLVAESGIRTVADVDRLGAAGFDAILVGESLMRQADLAAAARALVGRPKVARAGAAA